MHIEFPYVFTMQGNIMDNTKKNLLKMVDLLISNGEMNPSEISRYTKKAFDLTDPEDVRCEMEEWFIAAGIEQVTKRKFSLESCPYTKEEIIKIKENNNILLCIPKKTSREELGELFHINTWALADKLVTRVEEEKDFWFYTSKDLTPKWMKKTGVEVANLIDDNNYVHFSLERYIVFLARMRYLTGHVPDSEYWIWMTSGRYDRSGMLMAGFDRLENFSVHGWMPQFSSSFLGGRYGMTSIEKI